MFFAYQKSKPEPVFDHWSDRKCKACWRKGEDKPCPCWVEPVDGMTEANSLTGEERAIQGCMYQVLPRMLAYAIKASGRAAASADKTATETSRQTEVIARVLTKATYERNLILEAHGGKINGDTLPEPRAVSDMRPAGRPGRSVAVGDEFQDHKREAE